MAKMLAIYLTVDFIANRTSRTDVVEKIDTWIKTCRQSRSTCSRKHSHVSTRLPARLVQICVRREKAPFVRIIEGAELQEDVEYVTLSHCWGNTRMAPLCNATMDMYRSEIPWSALTKTFREAIHVSAALGFEYIWIDCFCINQDAQVDWLEETLSMASIYSNAVINIAATSSANGDGGLFPVTRSQVLSRVLSGPCVVHAKWSGRPPAEYVIFDPAAWQTHINQAVLNGRAWVLQERLLSPRTVHFAHEQVSWECSEGKYDHVWTTGVPYHSILSETSATAAFSHLNRNNTTAPDKMLHGCWLLIVTTYSECRLTKEADKLVAIAGLAQVFQTTLHYQASDYCAGLWRAFLLEGLLWSLVSPGRRYDTYVAPSWSWASVRGPVAWDKSFSVSASESNDTNVSPARFACRLQEVEINLLLDSNPFSPVTSSCLALTAPLYPVVYGPMDKRLSRLMLSINGRQFPMVCDLAQVFDDTHLYTYIALRPTERPMYFCRFLSR